MQPTTYGHGWYDLSKGINPVLLSALHLVRSYNGRHRYQQAAWVVDYAVNTAGRVRVGSRASPWRPRLAGTLHLYPPGQRNQNVRIFFPKENKLYIVIFPKEQERYSMKRRLPRAWRCIRS